MGLRFPDQPRTTVGDLQRDVAALVAQIERERRIFKHDIGTTETTIAHGFNGIPRTVHVTPAEDCTWWMSTPPTAIHIYLTASTALEDAVIEVVL
jgi:hypothetical protein